jgi:hypothetical protein
VEKQKKEVKLKATRRKTKVIHESAKVSSPQNNI